MTNTANATDRPVLAGDLQADLVAVEQMGPGALRDLADRLGLYDCVTVVCSSRLAPKVFEAKAAYDGEPSDDPRSAPQSETRKAV